MNLPKSNRYVPAFIGTLQVSVIQYFNGLYAYFKAFKTVKNSDSSQLGWLSKSIDEALFSIDMRNGNLTTISDSCEKLFGYTTEEFLSQPSIWKKIIFPPDNYLIKKNNTFLKAKKIISIQCRIVHKNNNIRWIRCRIIPLFDKKNELIGIDGLCRDITETMRMEETLKRSEANLRSVFNNTDVAYFLIDTDFKLISYNEQARQFALNPFNKILNNGDSVLKYFEPEKRLSYKKIMEEVLHSGNRNFEKNFTGVDGLLTWYEIQMFSVFDDEQKIFAFTVSVRDITKAKLGEQAIKNSETKYRYLFDSNPGAIIIWNIDDFNIIEVNETAVNLYGYTKEEFLEKTLLHLRPFEDCENFLHALQALNVKDGKVEGRWKHLNKKGEIMYMDILARKVVYGKKSVVATIANDVTEKLKLENLLAEQQMRKQYEITNAVITAQEQERTQLGEELHDNINQILATASLYLDCALRNDDTQVEMIQDSKNFVMEAINEIRKLSKSLLPPSLNDITLKETLQNLIRNIEQVHALEFHIEWNLKEELLSEKLKLTIYRIVQEQLNNIFKHAEASEVLIRLHQKKDAVILTIKDDGKGFNIFEKRNGVGLQNIKSRTELLNGDIAINSSPGNGCEVIIEFNLLEEPKETAALFN